jgi:hypothetical protein
MKHTMNARSLTLLGLLVLALLLALSLAPPTEVEAQGPPDPCENACWQNYAYGQQACRDHPDPPACHRSIADKLLICRANCE